MFKTFLQPLCAVVVILVMLGASWPTLQVANATVSAPELSSPTLPEAPALSTPELSTPDLSTPTLPEPPDLSVPVLPEPPDLSHPDLGHGGSGVYESCSLQANVTEVAFGGTITLTWSTSGFDSVTLNNDVVALNDSATFTITEDTTYTLRATTDDGSSTCTQTVIIDCIFPPVACHIEADRTTVEKGESTVIRWTSDNADEAVFRPGMISVPVDGSRTVSPSETTTYTVKFIQSETGQYKECPITITVTDTPPVPDPVCTLTPASKTIVRGNAVTLTWTTTNATEVTFADLNGTQAFTGNRSVSPTAPETTYTLTAKNADGVSVTCDSVITTEARPVPPACPLTAKDGRTIVTFSDVKLFSDRGAAQASGPEIAVDLPAADYKVTLVSWDGYIGRENITQPNESYTIAFTGAGYSTRSGAIADLADRVREATEQQVVNDSLTIASPITSVRADHAVFPDTSSPNSLRPICAAFDELPKEPLPTCDFIRLDDASIEKGSTTTLRWETTDASRIVINNGIGERTDFDGSVTVGPIADTTYTLRVFDEQDVEQDSCSVPITVTTPPVDTVPVCDAFTANPTQVAFGGGTTTLVWNTTDATSASINNGIGGVAVDGTRDIFVDTLTTFTLTARDADGDEDTCPVTVTVADEPNDTAPVCVAFTATPSAFGVGGGTTTLAWDVRDATEVTISDGVGTFDMNVDSVDVSVTQSNTYRLTARDADGDEVFCDAPVVVADPVPFSCANNVSFSANPGRIDEGDNATLVWSTNDVDSVSISGLSSSALDGSAVVSPRSDTTYVLTATQGSQSVQCPVKVEVDEDDGGGGGGGSSTPRCELDISDTRISRGDTVTLTWDSSRAADLTLSDDRGNVLVTTEGYLSDEKDQFFDGEIDVEPSRNTTYTLLVERGSRDRECEVSVRVGGGGSVRGDDITVLETRDQEPLVTSIALSSVPNTGFPAGPVLTAVFYILLGVLAALVAYLLVIRRDSVAGYEMVTPGSVSPKSDRQREHLTADEIYPTRDDLFVARVVPPVIPPNNPATTPVNLPTGTPVTGYHDYFATETTADTTESATATATATEAPVAPMPAANPHQVDHYVVTAIENRAHEQRALLSSDAIRHFVATTEAPLDRDEALDQVIATAKERYPLEDGWCIINEQRMRELCAVCQATPIASSEAPFVPATVPEGTGSLAEAIVTGNVVAAYELIGHRPMFALADAAADLDAVLRLRKGQAVTISNLLQTESAELTDAQLSNMIAALTGALDGTYTDEASAVKMAIMKAVRAAA